MLRPGYTPPNREDIRGHLLDKIHEKLTMKMKTELKGKMARVTYNAPVNATSLHTEGSAYFLSAVDMGTNKNVPTAYL